jgi:hypothetical protein
MLDHAKAFVKEIKSQTRDKSERSCRKLLPPQSDGWSYESGTAKSDRVNTQESKADLTPSPGHSIATNLPPLVPGTFLNMSIFHHRPIQDINPVPGLGSRTLTRIFLADFIQDLERKFFLSDYYTLYCLTLSAFHSRSGCRLIRCCRSLSEVSNEGTISPLSSNRFKNSVSESVNDNTADSLSRHSLTNRLPYEAGDSSAPADLTRSKGSKRCDRSSAVTSTVSKETVRQSLRFMAP